MAKTVGADSLESFAPETRLVLGGRDPAANYGFVNPPVQHVSTVLYPTAEDFLARRARYLYGRRGTPTSEALENALRAIEGAQCAGVAHPIDDQRQIGALGEGEEAFANEVGFGVAADGDVGDVAG